MADKVLLSIYRTWFPKGLASASAALALITMFDHRNAAAAPLTPVKGSAAAEASDLPRLDTEQLASAAIEACDKVFNNHTFSTGSPTISVALVLPNIQHDRRSAISRLADIANLHQSVKLMATEGVKRIQEEVCAYLPLAANPHIDLVFSNLSTDDFFLPSERNGERTDPDFGSQQAAASTELTCTTPECREETNHFFSAIESQVPAPKVTGSVTISFTYIAPENPGLHKGYGESTATQLARNSNPKILAYIYHALVDFRENDCVNNIEATICQALIDHVAHELGHVLGLEHSDRGLMKPKAYGELRSEGLSADEVEALRDHYLFDPNTEPTPLTVTFKLSCEDLTESLNGGKGWTKDLTASVKTSRPECFLPQVGSQSGANQVAARANR